MLRSAMHYLSPGGAGAKLSILIFHRVHAQQDELFPGEVDAARFDRICGWLSSWFNVLPLDNAVQQLLVGTLPARAAAVTFDDGYADNLTVAAPILLRHSLPATLFVASGYLNGGLMWNDRLNEALRSTTLDVIDLSDAGLPGLGRLPLHDIAARQQAAPVLLSAAKYLGSDARNAFAELVERLAEVARAKSPMLTTEQLRSWRDAGLGVGGHTATHPILRRLPLAEAANDIAQGRATLEDMLQQPVTLFAYPNGQPDVDYDADIARAVADAGFGAAFTTAWGACVGGDDRYQLPRFTPWDQQRWRFGARLVANLRRRGAKTTSAPLNGGANALLERPGRLV